MLISTITKISHYHHWRERGYFMIRFSILVVNRRSMAILSIGILGLLVAGIADGGASHWTSIGPDGGTVNTVAIDPDTPATVYAGTWGSVLKSTNGGENWTAMNTGLTSINVNSLVNVYALAIDPNTPATVYAGTYGGGVFKSTNGGENWTTMNTGLTSINVFALVIDPVHRQRSMPGPMGAASLRARMGAETGLP